MQLDGLIDCLIPRGGPSLMASVREHATVPYVIDGAGNCHVYVDRAADLDMAESIVVNAKTQRPGVCNSAETLLVHRDVADAFLPRVAGRPGRGRPCWATPPPGPCFPAPAMATEEDFATEFLGLTLSVAVVDDLDGAIDHIARFGSGHSEAIVTGDLAAADRFTAEVDAAAVLVNASTRFVDGEELGLGAEIGISTQKLHARGPMGLRELTSVKYVVDGSRAGAVMTGRRPIAGARDPPRGSPRVPGGRRPPVRLHRRRPPGPGRGGLPGRRRDRRGGLPGRPPGQAGPGRGSGRHRQDRAGQVGGPPDRQPAHPSPVLRGPRRVQGPLRVELQEAAAAHPGRLRPVLAGARGGHLLRGVPPDPTAARGDPVAGAGGPPGRRGGPGGAGDRGPAARDPLGVPGVDPRARHGAGHPDPAGLPHLQQHPRAVRGAEAPLPLPAHRLPPARAGAGHHRDPGARASARPWPTRWPGSSARSGPST